MCVQSVSSYRKPPPHSMLTSPTHHTQHTHTHSKLITDINMVTIPQIIIPIVSYLLEVSYLKYVPSFI